MNSTSLFWNNPQDIVRIQELLKSNNVCIGSSDTVLGLLAPLTLQGYAKLNTIKKRSEKPYIVLVGSLIQLELFAKLPKTVFLKKILEKYWPGPLTVILQRKPETLNFFRTENNTVAVRIPNHSGLLSLLQYINGVFSTSANKAGEPIPRTIEDVHPDILQAAAGIILDQNMQDNTVPSTIIDCSQEQLKLVREGAISFAEIEKVAEDFKKNY